MAKYLVIVESPAKVKTIKKFLGSNYTVVASNGHVRDLPKSQLGINVDGDYEPKYITIRGKGELLAGLRKEVKKADKIFLATDPDREGEAISWHLTYALNMEGKKVYRISFNEITKNAVKNSIKNPREIDKNLVDEQQARRMVDRMVGYLISPVLWEKVKRGLSAGRVQSVALRIICDREEEVNAFVPQEYWSLEAKLKGMHSTAAINAHFYGKENKKQDIKTEAQINEILEELKNKEFVVSNVKRGERIKKAPLPFITSTMQQEASKVLNFTAQKTMRIAQQLYEGVEVKGQGTIGLITYLRTDSVRISEEAQALASEYIKSEYGEAYLRKHFEAKNSDKKIQDAHEAIRPTDVKLTPATVKESLSRDQFRLYQLIWKRFMASMMSDARYETVSAKIKCGEYLFTSSTSRIAFEGFRCTYINSDEDPEEKNKIEGLNEGDVLELGDLMPKQHFTQAPAHYTEASLVKALEELGVGRPSTYAPTITTLLYRRYVVKEGRNLYITELGEAVNTIMKEAFPSIVDENFTAYMESLLDKVGEGVVSWYTVVSNFYPDLKIAVDEARDKLDKVIIEDEKTDVICEECGRNMVIKYGPHGKFLACPGFPECRNTKPYLEKAGVKCPICGSEVVIRKTKKGRRYYGCEKNPECDFMSWQKPSDKLCPRCGSPMLEKGKSLVCMNEQCGFVEER